MLRIIDRSLTLLETLNGQEQTDREKAQLSLYRAWYDLITDVTIMDGDKTPVQRVDYKAILQYALTQSKRMASQYSIYLKDESTFITALLYYVVSNLRIGEGNRSEELIGRFLPEFRLVDLPLHPVNSDQLMNIVWKGKYASCAIC